MDVEQIARSLTPSQRRMVARYEGGFNYRYVDMRVLPALNRIGLISRGDGEAMMLTNGKVHLNELGIAVRNHLKATGGSSNG